MLYAGIHGFLSSDAAKQTRFPFMKPTIRTLCSVMASLVFLFSAQADLPVSFNLAVDPTGVALQFDVVSDSSVQSIGSPTFSGTSDHDVKSAVIESGAHRFVVFSKTGEPIAATGEVNIVFSDALIPSDGAISLENITASNASGAVVTASPNTLPVLTHKMRLHQSLKLGSSLVLESVAYDLDGSLKTLTLLTQSTELDGATAQPFALSWTPASAGAYPLSMVAVDNLDQEKTFDLGVYQAYTDSEITDYSSFSSIHFGTESPDGSFSADPLDKGIGNGLAYFLGLNPHSLDLTRLPRVRVERHENGADLVITFIRNSTATNLDWNLRTSPDLQNFEAVQNPQISESDPADGKKTVEVRLPLDAGSLGPTFVDLEVKQSS